ncbi:MAG: hypothetical protein QOK43_522 [Acidimicrobiaceae bacterium]|jgi:hypothetical protein|nr:hypothetical protein [Acidimicrobiaceae bacterium]MDQ1443864.1 hypothetical protein [Acidimicrobiaceae bacterium]
MPGPILHQGAQVLCAHGGQAAPPAAYPRVLVNGMAVAMQPVPWLVAGCLLPPPPAANGPCVSATFVTGATRVFVNIAVPVLLADSQAVVVPTGTPLVPAVVQPRVVGV